VIEYPRRCALCGEELYSDDELVEHIGVELRRAAERHAAAALVRAQEEAARAEVTPAAPRSLGRLFDQRIGATFMVDPYHLLTAGREQRDAIAERVQDTLHRQLAQYVEPWGVDLRRESVYLRQTEEYDGPVPRIRFEATWSPDPARGCLFRGGPMDGEVLGLPREDDLGRPRRLIVRAAMAQPAWRSDATEPPREPLVTETRYRLAGIDPDVDQWVYAWDR
jgi:hypothetical protein